MLKETENLRLRVFYPFVAGLLLVLAVSIAATYLFKRDKTADEISHEKEELKSLFPALVAAEIKTMSCLIEEVKQDRSIRELWQARDRDALAEHTRPIIETLKTKYLITHLYFIDRDRTCFLRAHKPSAHGDIIQRFTLDQALQQQKPAFGIELGPFGTFTLRLVHPWIIDGKTAGFIELGMGIAHLMPVIQNTLDVNIILLIEKKYLDQAKWEQGLSITGQKNSWDNLENHVIVNVPKNPEALELLSWTEERRKKSRSDVFITTHSKKNYGIGLVELFDARGLPVGEIVILKNISEFNAMWVRLLQFQLITCAAVCLVLFSMFYTFLGRIQNDILAGRSALKKEVDERRKAEDELRRYQTHLQELVEERTTRLRTSNERLQQEIQERHQAQNELQQLNKYLENRVEERTRELLSTQDALLRKEKLGILEKWAGALGQEIRNPLGVIKNVCYYLNLKKQEMTDPSIMENIAIIEKEVEIAGRIVSGIQAFSELKAPRLSATSLGSVVQKALAQAAVPNTIQVRVEVPDTLPAVNIDADQVELMTFNIIENALQAMRGGDTLSLTARETADRVELMIADTGSGIPKENLEKIFDPLFSDKGNSAGLGLPIAQAVADRNNVEIAVASTLGQGSTFTVRFKK